MCELLFHKLNGDLDYEKCMQFIRQYGSKTFIFNIKKTGVLLDSYPGTFQYQDLVERLSSFFHDTPDSGYWYSLLKEADIINTMYHGLYNNEAYKKAEGISKSTSVTAFLICTEYCLKEMWEKSTESDSDKHNGMFKLAFEDQITRSESNIVLYESALSMIPNVLSYLLFYKGRNTKHQTTVAIEDIQDSSAHMRSISEKEFIDMISKEWQFDMRTIRYQTDTEIECSAEPNRYEDYIIVTSRFEQMRNELQEVTAFLYQTGRLESLISKDYNDLDRFINMQEYYAVFYLKEALFVENIAVDGIVVEKSAKVNVDIRMLVRAYACLILEAQQFINSIQKMDSNILSEVCMLVDLTCFKTTLARYGVNEVNCDSIIKILVFNRNHDLIDCPLIRVNDCYYIIPTVVASMDISQAVLSRISEFEFRGSNFEEVVISDLRKIGIKATGYKHKVGNEEYQCDVLFSIGNNDVYICECKAWGMPRNAKGYYEREAKIKDATKQLDRIADVFEADKDLIMEVLQITRIRDIYRMIIINTPIGLNCKCENTLVIDYSALKRFLDREKPAILNLDKKEIKKYTPKGFCEYDGKVTDSRMKKFLVNPAQVHIAHRLCKRMKLKKPADHFTVEYDDYFVRIPFADNLDEMEEFKRLIEG